MKFTKAPWKQYRHNHAPNEIDVMADGWLLASVYTPGNVPDDRPTQEANARLIAKAPEMYDLLKAMLEKPVTRELAAKLIDLVAEIENRK